jgi:hypothetical protein
LINTLNKNKKIQNGGSIQNGQTLVFWIQTQEMRTLSRQRSTGAATQKILLKSGVKKWWTKSTKCTERDDPAGLDRQDTTWKLDRGGIVFSVQ